MHRHHGDPECDPTPPPTVEEQALQQLTEIRRAVVGILGHMKGQDDEDGPAIAALVKRIRAQAARLDSMGALPDKPTNP